MNSINSKRVDKETMLARYDILEAISHRLDAVISMTIIAMHSNFDEITNINIMNYVWLLHENITSIKDLHELLYRYQ